MTSTGPYRIDPPSTAVPRMAAAHALGTREASCRSADVIAAGSSGVMPEVRCADAVDLSLDDMASHDEWLSLQAGDLIQRLQTWASDLDAREAQLNARASLQDHRERRFRLSQQDVATELAEQQRSIDRLRQDMEAQARRLAFQDDPPG